MVHYKPESLGETIKSARQHANLTIETLAERVGITERYLYRIENEGQKPSYDILYKIIRELSMSADSIFYPEKQIKNDEVETLIHMLYDCDQRSIKIIQATIRAALESQSDE